MMRLLSNKENMNEAETPAVWQPPGVLYKEHMNTYITSRYDLFLKDLETVVNIDSDTHFIQGVERVITYFEERFSALNGNPDEYIELDSIIPKIQLICHVCLACAEGKLI